MRGGRRVQNKFGMSAEHSGDMAGGLSRNSPRPMMTPMPITEVNSPGAPQLSFLPTKYLTKMDNKVFNNIMNKAQDRDRSAGVGGGRMHMGMVGGEDVTSIATASQSVNRANFLQKYNHLSAQYELLVKPLSTQNRKKRVNAFAT